MLEKTLESPLDCKEIKLVNPKGNQPWIFSGRTDAEAEASILWPPDVKSQLTGKDPEGGKDWGQEEKGVTEDEMVGWHHRLNGRVWANSGRRWWIGKPAVHGVTKSWTRLSDWTTAWRPWANWPKPPGPWGLTMLTLVTPPCYLTISQSENCAQSWSQTLRHPLPHGAFESALRKPFRELRAF